MKSQGEDYSRFLYIFIAQELQTGQMTSFYQIIPNSPVYIST
jgi:hypothetical protein